MRQKISHPTDDPNLPSFIHPNLAEVIDELDLVADCWDLLRGEKTKKIYLPKEPGEHSRNYKSRLDRSSYPSFYKDGINAFAGVLSRYELKGFQKNFEASLNDIDGQGNSLKAWGMIADMLLMRDNGCLLMADMPSDKVDSRADEIIQGRRPFFSIAERKNVLNWRLKKVGRKLIPTAVTVREWHETEDGKYGMKLEPYYKVMKNGMWQSFKIKDSNDIKTPNSGDRLELVDEGIFLGAGGSPLKYPPVIWYGPPRDGFGGGAPMLLSLANLTLDWFREYSDLKELLHKCALPTAVIKDAMRPRDQNGNTMPVILGPNSLIELFDQNADAFYLEPSATSLDKHLQHLSDIEKLIDRSTLSFLFSGDAERTATQAQLESAQIQASITSLGEAKSSTWQSLGMLWGDFTGEYPDPDAGIDLLPGITDKPVDDALITLAGNLYDKGLLMRETVTKLAQRRGMLRPGIDGEQEAEQLKEEDRIEEEKTNPPIPNPDDLAGDDVDAQGLPLS